MAKKTPKPELPPIERMALVAAPVTIQVAPTITTAEQYAAAEQVMANINAVTKQVKAESELELVPLKAGYDAVKNRWDGLLKPLSSSKAKYLLAMNEYQNMLAVKQQAILDAHEAGKIKKFATVETKLAAVTTDFTSSNVRTVDDITVEDITKVPHQYLVVDMVAVKAAFKTGVKVPGIKYAKKKQVATR